MTPTDTVAPADAATRRVERLNTASARNLVDPDDTVTGQFGEGQIIPTHLLSIADLGLDLEAGLLEVLAREEVASIAQEGIRFEAVLIAGFALMVVRTPTPVDPRIEYLLHEMGEETRHQRLFVRMLRQLRPAGVNPLLARAPQLVFQWGVRRIVGRPALLCTLVLGGEEIPDLIQKLAAEDPATDPFLRAVNKYHRMEEARHLAFARAVLSEEWARAGVIERVLVRRVAPRIIGGMFAGLVHPGVYRVVGLRPWRTWLAANRSPSRLALRHRATRPILAALVDAGAVDPSAVPRPWRVLCGVDRAGEPVT